MGRSSSLAKAISFAASIIYFLLILLQIPLFRVPCRCGICSSPIELTCSQLAAQRIVPTYVTRSLLYPGDALFKYYGGGGGLCDMNMAEKRMKYDILQLEIMVGSYLCVCGALLKLGRVNLLGVLLLSWGLAKHAPPNAAQIYPIHMLFALLIACLCVRRDLKRILRSFRAPSRVASRLKQPTRGRLSGS